MIGCDACHNTQATTFHYRDGVGGAILPGRSVALCDPCRDRYLFQLHPGDAMSLGSAKVLANVLGVPVLTNHVREYMAHLA